MSVCLRVFVCVCVPLCLNEFVTLCFKMCYINKALLSDSSAWSPVWAPSLGLRVPGGGLWWRVVEGSSRSHREKPDYPNIAERVFQ